MYQHVAWILNMLDVGISSSSCKVLLFYLKNVWKLANNILFPFKGWKRKLEQEATGGSTMNTSTLSKVVISKLLCIM